MLAEILAEYLKFFPTEKNALGRLLQQISDEENLHDRRNFNGHITGSAIVLSPDRTEILFIHHKLFNRWQQPGGHWEGDDEPNPLVAQREGEEETAAHIASYLPLDTANPLVPLDIDSHQVPARDHKNEPIHWHHDFRYVFVAKDENVRPQESEINAVRWFALSAPETQIIKRTMAKLARLSIHRE